MRSAKKTLSAVFYDDIYLGVRAVIFPQDIGEDSGERGNRDRQGAVFPAAPAPRRRWQPPAESER